MQTEHVEYELVYTAAMEREYIKSQQRPATPLHPLAPRAVSLDRRQQVAAFFQKFPHAWTVAEICALTRLSHHAAYNSIRFFLTKGQVEAVHPSRGHRGQAQRYRWIARGA